MAVKFSAAAGGFIQDAASSKITFEISGELFQPVLEAIGAPVYNKNSFNINTATLVADNAQVGQFTISIVSYDNAGANPVTHTGAVVTVSSAGQLRLSMTINNATIASDRVVKILASHDSGTPSSNISVTLE